MSAPTAEQTVQLHPLHIGEIEDGAAEVGRPDTGVFVSLPEPGIAIIRYLQEGLTRSEVSARFAEQYGEPPDLDDFLTALGDCGFVRQIGDEPAAEPAEPDAPATRPQMRGWRLFATLPTERVAWLLSRPAKVIWVLAWLAGPAVFALRPDLIPVAADGRLGIGVAADVLLLTALAWALVIAHESAHLVAVRARGCMGVLRLSNRLHLLVAETDMSSVRSLPRDQRYAPYLAGMTFNLALLDVMLVLQLSGVDGQPVRAVAFLCLTTVLFELAFFLRTDMYYVIATALRLGNLMSDTWHWVGNQLARAVGRPARYDLSAVPARELRIVRWYSVLLVVGVGVVIGQFVLYGLPLLLTFVRDAVARLGTGPGTAGFWDAMALLAITLAHFGTLGVVAIRRRLRPAAPGA